MSELNKTVKNELPFTTVSHRRSRNNYSQRRKNLLEQVASGKLDPEKAERLLRSNYSNRRLSFSVTRNGALALYGLQNHRPVVFYLDQWTRLIKFLRTTDVFDKFVENNSDSLKSRKNRGKQFTTNYEPKDFENNKEESFEKKIVNLDDDDDDEDDVGGNTLSVDTSTSVEQVNEDTQSESFVAEA